MVSPTSRERVSAAYPVQRRWPRFRVTVPAVVEFPGTIEARRFLPAQNGHCGQDSPSG
jgi:hypothetical protein